MNSLFDPYFAAGGHQPYGFDQIVPFYSRYMVDRCDIDITFSDPSADGLVVGAFLKNFYDTNTLQGSTVNAASERPSVWCKPLNNTGSQVIHFRKSVDLAKMMGLTKSQYESGWFALSGLTTTDPSQCPYLVFACADSRSNATATSCTVRIRLTYHATFWGRKMAPQS
jgi:hypothetical protein